MSLVIYAFQSDLEKVRRIGFPTTTYAQLRTYDYANDVVVRWGKSNAPVNGAGAKVRDFLHVLNPAGAIRLNVQKAKALSLLSEVVRTPRIWTKAVPKRKLAVVRPLTHSQGRDFTVVRGPRRIPRGHYATEFIRTDFEVRVWVCRTGPTTGHTMCARRVKMKKDVEGVYPCRSEWGYRWMKTPKVLHQMVIKAGAKVGLDVYAADVLRKGGRWFLTELNSAVCVDARSIREFVQLHLPEVARARYPNLTIPDAETKAPSDKGPAPGLLVARGDAGRAAVCREVVAPRGGRLRI